MPARSIHERPLRNDRYRRCRRRNCRPCRALPGNGQSELFLPAISGERPADEPGAVVIGRGGRRGIEGGIDARRKLGAAFVPGKSGSATPPCRATGSGNNTVLSHHAIGGIVSSGFIAFDKARRMAAKVVGDFDVRTPGADALARKLSGGNLQKFVVGREIVRRPQNSSSSISRPGALMPGRRGVIRQALIDLAAQGAAVLVISQDLDELFAIADRMARDP